MDNKRFGSVNLESVSEQLHKMGSDIKVEIVQNSAPSSVDNKTREEMVSEFKGAVDSVLAESTHMKLGVTEPALNAATRALLRYKLQH